MAALIDGDLATAAVSAGHPLSPFLVTESWLWRIRRDQVLADPASAEWVARAAVAVPSEVAVGHGGFHGPPDAEGTVEVAYTVDPAYRRRGFARAILDALLARADADPRVSGVRASIRPDNRGSLATIAGRGFVKIGEQWDREDGLEHVFWRRAT